jgi:tryptophan 7-halogenase
MRVVIAGGGLSGWITAHRLSALIGSAITSVHVINSGPSNDAPVQIARPQTLRLLERSGIDEADLLAHAGASFHLGYAFTGWQGDETTQFLPTGLIKAPIGPVSFHHLALRLIANGTPVRLSDYSLEAMCAQTQRFAPAHTEPNSIVSSVKHGLHIETDPLVAWLKTKAVSRGSHDTQTQIMNIIRNDHGEITLIQCEDEMSFKGDLFIDCSGDRRVLGERTFIAQNLHVPGTKWDWTSTIRSGPDLPLFVNAQATNGGCTHSLCTQNQEHKLRLTLSTGGKTSNLGRLDQFWAGNCVAIGEAGAVLSPSSGLALHVAVAGLDLLMRLLPSPASTGAEALEYNRIFAADVAQAQMWAVLPFALNTRHRQPFWDAMRDHAQTPSITTLLDTWTKLGRINAGEGGDWFDDMDWVSVLWAFGALPTRYDQVADGIDHQAISNHFAKIRAVLLAAIGKLPGHSDYVRAVLTR